jgi:zinc protease
VLKPQPEIEQKGLRRVQVKAPAELPYLTMGWKIPVVKTATEKLAWEPYALEVLAGVLDGGNSARFAKELVREQQVAAGVGAGNNLFSRQQDVFMVAGTPAKGKTLTQLEQAVREQINKVQQHPVSQQELDRVKV